MGVWVCFFFKHKLGACLARAWHNIGVVSSSTGSHAYLKRMNISALGGIEGGWEERVLIPALDAGLHRGQPDS